MILIDQCECSDSSPDWSLRVSESLSGLGWLWLIVISCSCWFWQAIQKSCWLQFNSSSCWSWQTSGRVVQSRTIVGSNQIHVHVGLGRQSRRCCHILHQRRTTIRSIQIGRWLYRLETLWRCQFGELSCSDQNHRIRELVMMFCALPVSRFRRNQWCRGA